MKTRSLLTLVCGLVAGLAAWATDEAVSLNTHGMVKVETSTTNVLIAVPWNFYTPSAETVTNLPVNHLVWPKNLDDGDMLMMVTPRALQSGSNYETWMLTRPATKSANASDAAGTWVPALTASVSGDSQAAASDAVARGLGLWLIRQNPKDNAGNWKPFYLYGQYASNAASVQVTGGSSAAANPVMVANPYCQALAVNADVTWSGVGANDTLSLPNGTDAWDLALWDATQQKWYVSKSTRQGRKVVTTKNYNLSVPAGHGFWYIRRTAGAITITFNAK